MAKSKKPDPIDEYSKLSPAAKIEHDKWCLLEPFLESAKKDDDHDELVRYIIHCGITPEDIDRANGNWMDAVLRHYLVAGAYDIERAAQDLLRWPPVAARLKELEAADEAKKEGRAAQERTNAAKRRRHLNGAQVAN